MPVYITNYIIGFYRIINNNGGGTHKKVGGRNLITIMVAAGGIRVGGTLHGAENTVGPYM
jgi:hypothetical protein